jgi:hypothetical protein
MAFGRKGFGGLGGEKRAWIEGRLFAPDAT